MPKDKDKKGTWITMRGKKVFIPYGTSKDDAILKAISRVNLETKITAVSERVSIKQQLRLSKDKLNKMQPVFNQSSDYGGITDRRVAVTALKAKLAKDDGFVERKGFKVQVGKRITPKYVHSNADAMTIMAIPAVIKNGEIIYQNDDHKLRNYGTVTFGAKVVFNGKEGIMAVSAKITEGNFYTAHRVLKPNGEIFEI